MRAVKIAAGVFLASFLFVGCGSDGRAVPVESGHLDGTWEYGEVDLPDGRVLECVTMRRSVSQSQWGGVSCNWDQSEVR